MVHSYLTYENFTKEKNKKEFPFYLDWIMCWDTHKGNLEITDAELLSEGLAECMQKFIKNNEAINAFTLTNIPFNEGILAKLTYIMASFGIKQIKCFSLKQLALKNEYMEKLVNPISQQEYLEVLKLVNCQLDSESLEILGRTFASLPSLQIINLAYNKIKQIGEFLGQICEDLELKHLDLSYNLITDNAIPDLIKYVLRNSNSTMEKVKLTGNKFTPQGIKTLYKAQRMASKAMKSDKKVLELDMIPFETNNVKEIFKEDYKGIEIVRKSLNEYSKLKPMPTKKEWQHQISVIEEQIHNVMNDKDKGPIIEDIKDVLKEVENCPFEFPKIKLERIYKFIEKALQQAVQHESLYCLEVLLDCAKIIDMSNVLGAEEQMVRLKKKCQKIIANLVAVLNMEIDDENALNELLDTSLEEARKLGIRGDLIDTCIKLQQMRDRYIEEIQEKNLNRFEDDSEDYKNEEVEDVFKPEFDTYITKTEVELEMTGNENVNLGFHSYRADYIAISQLGLEEIRQNLRLAANILKHEESYAHRNISNRCQFLLCGSFFDTAWGCSKNDTFLVIARLIFRYRNNLDNVFNITKIQEPIIPINLKYG